VDHPILSELPGQRQLLIDIIGTQRATTGRWPTFDFSLYVGFCSANAATRSCALPFGLAPKRTCVCVAGSGLGSVSRTARLGRERGRTELHNAHSQVLGRLSAAGGSRPKRR
jgi:hypothetical protein